MDNNNHQAISVVEGITLRDFMAVQVNAEDVEQIRFTRISRRLEERLVGRPYQQPQPPEAGAIDRQLYDLAWQMEVKAAIRYMYADAMLKVRDAK